MKSFILALSLLAASCWAQDSSTTASLTGVVTSSTPTSTVIVGGDCDSLGPAFAAQCKCTRGTTAFCTATPTPTSTAIVGSDCDSLGPNYAAQCKCTRGTTAFCSTTSASSTAPGNFSTVIITITSTISSCPPTVVSCPYTTAPIVTAITTTSVMPVVSTTPSMSIGTGSTTSNATRATTLIYTSPSRGPTATAIFTGGAAMPSAVNWAVGAVAGLAVALA